MWTISYWLTLGLLWGSLGSFLTVLGERLVSGQALWIGRSQCDSCAQRISWYALIPIVGYGLVRGRCQCCQARIPWSYPLSELFAVLSGSVIMAWDTHPSLSLFLFFIIFTMAICDYKQQWVPDRLQVLLGIAIIIERGSLPTPLTPLQLLTPLVIGGLLLGLATLSHGGIGGADIKLLTLLALHFDYYAMGIMIVIATGMCLSWCAIRYHHTHQLPSGLPFVPFLAFAYPLVAVLPSLP